MYNFYLLVTSNSFLALPYEVRAYTLHVPRLLLQDMLDVRCEAMIVDGLLKVTLLQNNILIYIGSL